MPMRFLEGLRDGSRSLGRWLGSVIIAVLTLAVLFSLCGFVVVLAGKIGMTDVQAGFCLVGGCLIILAIQMSSRE